MVVKGLKTQVFKQWPAKLALLFICSLGLTAPGLAQTEPQTSENLSRVITTLVSGNRDSMMNEIKHYTLEIEALRDSMAFAGGDVGLGIDQRQRFLKSIEEISIVISEITEELSHLEFEISDNMISLLDESGEGIVINIPEDMDDHVKEGIESITRIVLAQLPDTVGVEPGINWNWHGGHEEAPSARRISHGNVVKVLGSLDVASDEDIRGDVVVVAGDVRVEGRIEGDLAVIMGDLELAGDAEILGEVVVIMGTVTQEDDSCLNKVTIVDPLGFGHGFSLEAVKVQGKVIFISTQMLFILALAVVLLGMGIVPDDRINNVCTTIKLAPGTSLGIGSVVATLGHTVVLLLIGMLVATVIGIPLAVLLAFAMGLFWVVATGVSAVVLGEKLKLSSGDGTKNRWISVLGGMFALHLVPVLGLIFIVFTEFFALGLSFVLFGICIKTTAYFFGLGAILSSRLGTKSP
jgi:hypothetical protein